MQNLLRHEGSRKALEIASRFADGQATLGELRFAQAQAEAAAREAGNDEYMDEIRANFRWDAEYEAVNAARRAAEAVVSCVAEEIDPTSGGQITFIREDLQLPDLLREIFGNPFRWTVIDPAWLQWNDGAVRSMARAIYDDRAFDHLPILADALEEAGCDNRDILDHCRFPGDHVRGCWVVDLLLGNE